MAGIEFDDRTATALARAAAAASDRLRRNGPSRRGAVEYAVVDFDGSYAGRFTEAATIESTDRVGVARALDELADRVTAAVAAAARERARRRDLVAWEERDAARRRDAADDPFAGALAFGAGLFDPRPSDVPERPDPVGAGFMSRERRRTGDGTGHGRSSADPERLLSFVRSAEAADRATASDLVRLRSAWARFKNTCSWAPIGQTTFLLGFERYLDENDRDVRWIERITAAFERAGGNGSLSNATLDIAATEHVPSGLRALFAGGLTATEVAAAWRAFVGAATSGEDVRGLPITVLTRLGNLEGIPYSVRAIANRAVLMHQIEAAELALADLTRSDAGHDIGGAAFAVAVRQLTALQQIRVALDVKGRSGSRFLLSLSDDRPSLAAIAIGDVDVADNVTWAVPGMGSSTLDMVGWTNAAQSLYDAQRTVDARSRHAVVAWIGYDAPGVPVADRMDFGVMGMHDAEVGGRALARALRGLDAVRSDRMPSTNVVAHSYGSTTAAVALTRRGVHVDTFTTIGSAGLPDDITRARQLHASQVYAGQARNVIPGLEPGKGDQWAAIGRLGDHHQDPTGRGFGATTFGADGTPGLKAVTDHGVHTSDGTGYLDKGTESLRNVALASTGQGHVVSAYHPKGMTDLERRLAYPPVAPGP